MKRKINKLLLCIFFMLLGFITYSQGTKPPVPSGTPPWGLPIDGGLSFLIIAGAAYGAFELRKRKK
jgi:hypothetical protein